MSSANMASHATLALDAPGAVSKSGAMQQERWAKAGIWLVCAGAALAGCSKKPSAKATPEPLSSASDAAAMSVTEKDKDKEPEKPKPALSYRLGYHFLGKVTLFPLLKGVLACIDCDIGDKPNNDRHVFFFDGKETKELPNLLSDKRISANIGQSVTELLKPFDGGKYTFSGTGPNQLGLQVYGWRDDGSNGRQGYPHEERYLSFDGKSWQGGAAQYTQNYLFGRDRPYNPPRELQRKYDNARLHGGSGIVVASDDGPLLALASTWHMEGGTTLAPHVDLWDGKAWQRHDAPWDSTFTVQRLVDGRTLVLADNGVFGIDSQGVASPVALEDEPRGADVKLLLVGDEPWLVSPRNVYLPEEHGLAVAIVPSREAALARPAPPAPDALAIASAATAETPVAPTASAPSAAPSASVALIASATPSANVALIASAAPSAAAEPAPGIPALTGFSASCKTPFVVLFTPPHPAWNYSDAVRNFVDAAPLQDSLWFAEFTRNKVTYFGAQAADEAAARALMAAYVAKVPKAKPILGCLDIKAYLPDPYAPKWDAERLLINLASGLIL